LVTLKDISEKAGVSISTVSRIINNDRTKKSSRKTAEKVWKIVKELGYVPNTNARNLVKRYGKPENTKTNIIGCYIGSIPGKESLNVINEHRFKAFGDTINKYNLELCKNNIQKIEFSTIEGYKAMKAIHKFGLKVPKNISIIGIANLEMSEYIRPTLTTVHVPREELGIIAPRVLIDKIESSRRIPLKVELPFKLIERESCAAITK
jgi:DNA-binding LacI/PurR family transcriptional regulator